MNRKTFLWTAVGLVIFWILIHLGGRGLFVFAFGNTPANPASFQLPGDKVYRSKKLGLAFSYPERYKLKVNEKDGVITVEHAVSFEHFDPCDRTTGNQKSKKIYDFYAQISILPLTPTELFLQYGMNRNENGDVAGAKESFEVAYGELEGFRVYNGNHGCGPYSYFFQIDDEKVLRVDRYPAPEFREVPEEEKQMYSRLRAIILPENEQHIFGKILHSLKWNLQ